MPTLTFNFASSASLTLSQAEVTGGVAQLSTYTRTDLAYDKTYDSDTGITYDRDADGSNDDERVLEYIPL
jgi:hypothetical protein